jgi:DNA-binding beta-propeller fold protein YncE
VVGLLKYLLRKRRSYLSILVARDLLATLLALALLSTMGGANALPEVIGQGVDGPGLDDSHADYAILNGPAGMAFDERGNLFFADHFNHRVCRVDAITGTVSTVAGDGQQGFSGDGGSALEARLNGPFDVAIGGNNLFISDSYNHRVRAVNLLDGTIRTVAGSGEAASDRRAGAGLEVSLKHPKSIAYMPGGRLIIGDSIRGSLLALQINAGMVRPVLLPSPAASLSPMTRARRLSHYSSYELAAAPGGALYVSDYDASVVYRLGVSESDSAIWLDGSRRFEGRPIRGPMGVAVGPEGEVHVVDSGNSRLLTFDQSSREPLAVRAYADAATNSLETKSSPSHLAVSGDGDLWQAHFLNGRLDKIGTTRHMPSPAKRQADAQALASLIFSPLELPVS